MNNMNSLKLVVVEQNFILREKLANILSRNGKVGTVYQVADPANLDRVIAELGNLGQELAKGGILEDELSRALEPTLTAIKEQLRRNHYWLNVVLAGVGAVFDFAGALGNQAALKPGALTSPVVMRLKFQDPARIPPIRLKVEGSVEESK